MKIIIVILILCHMQALFAIYKLDLSGGKFKIDTHCYYYLLGRNQIENVIIISCRSFTS
jgi:hypothetical protein